MLSFKKILLTGLIVVPIVFIVAIRITPYCVDGIVKSFSGILYYDDSDTSDAIVNSLLLFLVFSIITFYWNARALRRRKSLTVTRLSLESLLDLVAIPVCIVIMVIKNNGNKKVPNMSSLLNPLALVVFPICKHLIISLTRRKS